MEGSEPQTSAANRAALRYVVTRTFTPSPATVRRRPRLTRRADSGQGEGKRGEDAGVNGGGRDASVLKVKEIYDPL